MAKNKKQGVVKKSTFFSLHTGMGVPEEPLFHDIAKQFLKKNVLILARKTCIIPLYHLLFSILIGGGSK